MGLEMKDLIKKVAEGISDYLIQGKTGEILPEIVQEIKRIMT